MAGANESPRQQMINMMYIVLTAMLALQVSSSVIDKFTDLDRALGKSVKDYQEVEKNTIAALDKKIKDFKPGSKSHSRAKDAIANAQVVKQETEKILTELDNIRTSIEKAADGKKSEEEKVTIHMKEGNKGENLEKSLKAYCKKLKEITKGSKEIPDMIAPGNKDNPNYESHDQSKKAQDFLETHFAHTPMAAALATITYMKTEVLKTESIALKELGAAIEGQKIVFNKIQATYSAPSMFVAERDPYVAKMFVFASSTQIKTKMTVNGSPIKVDADGFGLVSIPTSRAGSYNWKGNIKIIKPNGDTEDFPLEGEYKVVKSDVQWINNAPPALYEGCQNDLSCIAPALGASFSPSFSGSGAQFRPGSKKGQVIIIPGVGAKKVIARVSNSGKMLGQEEFTVKPVPKAELEIPGVNLEKGIPIAKLRAVNMKLKPTDSQFAEILPKEANYQVGSWEATLVRGGRQYKSIKGSGSTAGLRAIGNLAKRGDMLSIKITKAIRINSVGSRLPAKLVNRIVNVSIR